MLAFPLSPTRMEVPITLVSMKKRGIKSWRLDGTRAERAIVGLFGFLIRAGWPSNAARSALAMI